MIIFVNACSVFTQCSVYTIYIALNLLRASGFVVYFVLCAFFSVALHGATVEIIQLNRHLRHWFSVFFSMNARIEYMFLVEYGFVLRKTQRSLAHHDKKMY